MSPAASLPHQSGIRETPVSREKRRLTGTGPYIESRFLEQAQRMWSESFAPFLYGTWERLGSTTCTEALKCSGRQVSAYDR